jgi:fructose-1,6-bisphosphatase/inositol monophosphatase family enzyme
MLDPIVSVWDLAALLPVVTEAGGSFSDWSGEKTIHSGNAIATNSLVYEQLMALVGERDA